MKSLSKFFFFFILFFCNSIASSQIEKENIQSKSFKEIAELFKEEKDTMRKFFYINEYLNKGKSQKDILKICQAYHHLYGLFESEKSLVYLDSIIDITKYNPSIYYPALAYKSKGDFYRDRNDYTSALDAYLQFSSFSKATQNQPLIVNSNYYIGITKRLVGDPKGALKILNKNFAYAQKNKNDLDSKTYLNSITALVNIHNDMKAIDSAIYYSNYGMQEAIRLNKKELIHHFSLSRGVAHYFQSEFYIAIDSIEKQIPYFEQSENYRNLEFAYFYAGESYRRIDYVEKAIAYYQKVDTLFLKNQSLFPTLREAYSRLINHYKGKKDTLHQLIYLNRRNTVDSIYKANNPGLYKDIIKEYQVPELEAQIKSSNKKLDNLTRNQLILGILMLVLLVGFIIQFRKRRIDRKRFQEILDSTTAKKSSIKKKQSDRIASVPEDIVKSILDGLEKFELEHQFTSNDITLNSLSHQLLTNPNYLSKVVNHYKKNSFSNYINNLRIDYTIEQLKTNPDFKKYTLKAISYEVGFNNVQSFSKAFYNSKGINPSYFMKELKKIAH